MLIVKEAKGNNSSSFRIPSLLILVYFEKFLKFKMKIEITKKPIPQKH